MWPCSLLASLLVVPPPSAGHAPLDPTEQATDAQPTSADPTSLEALAGDTAASLEPFEPRRHHYFGFEAGIEVATYNELAGSGPDDEYFAREIAFGPSFYAHYGYGGQHARLHTGIQAQPVSAAYGEAFGWDWGWTRFIGIVVGGRFGWDVFRIGPFFGLQLAVIPEVGADFVVMLPARRSTRRQHGLWGRVSIVPFPGISPVWGLGYRLQLDWPARDKSRRKRGG